MIFLFKRFFKRTHNVKQIYVFYKMADYLLI